ncbi:MAG: sulfatase/phosphatase domain-containing protein, partial [Paludibacter sp.]
KELTSWKYQQYMRDYLATILAVDENIGRLMKYLEDIGELDNTIIIYTSDQGFYMGEHGWFDKRFMYEESQRTPFLVRYPKAIKPNSVTKALTMNIDIAPTLLDYAGLRIPDEIQGRSLKPILDLEGKTPEEWREAVYYHYYEYPGWHSVKRHYGIRTNRYKLIHFYNDINEWELYDLKGDVPEKKNVYNDPHYKSVQEYMLKLLEKTCKEYKDDDPTEKVKKF